MYLSKLSKAIGMGQAWAYFEEKDFAQPIDCTLQAVELQAVELSYNVQLLNRQ
ncbi:MAG: hypothetical protein KME13_09555 [Myxacorys californica WJT36-NPBG1]|jgi:hypothetical protein|nr:hypothetical protein [Myxacorys californica WJT36-NPBG1]